ncbi:hypothetical protein D3C86_1727310 [compost metagenome]
MRQRYRQHIRLRLQRAHPVDEGPHPRRLGEVEPDHAAVVQTERRTYLASRGGQRQVVQLLRPLHPVGVRILLEGDQQVGSSGHGLRDVAVQVQFSADGRVRPDHRPQSRQQIAFTVVIAVGDHGPVQQ